MFIRKLAFSNFAARKARVALTVAAVALSVSLVVSVTSGYASLFEAAFRYLNLYMGSTDARVGRMNDPMGVPGSVVDELRRDPDVRRADGRLNLKTFIPDPSRPQGNRHIQAVGIDRPGDQRASRLLIEPGGKWFETNTGDVAVIDQAAADVMKVQVGGTFSLPYAGRKKELTVVGIVHKPAVLAVHFPSMYVPLRTLQDLVGNDQYVSEVQIDLKGEANAREFAARWQQKLAAYKPALQIHLASDIRQQMDKDLQGIKMLSYLGGGVSMLAATFIIFSALSMGVSERQRSLAMLRAVGAFRSQIGWLVVFEGLILATVGLVIGVLLGYAWVKILALWFHDIFTAGAVISWGGVLFGTAGTLLAALAASVLPAWTATRVSPLEAMSPLSKPAGGGAPWRVAVVGAMLISIDPLLLFEPWVRVMHAMGAADPAKLGREWKFYLHFALGLPGLFIGFFLLAPMFVWVMERVAGPVVAALLGLRYAMLRQQLSSGIWRAAGTAAALMVGLAVLIVLQVTGHTLLKGWKLPDKFPDVFIGTSGLSPAQQKQLAQTPGISEIMPISIASPTLGDSPFAIGATMLLPDATMFIGVDPDKAFRMMELDFREGNSRDAAARLKEGGWLIVTQEYHELTGKTVGDTIQLAGKPFKIAGVVWSPGIDVMVGMYDMGDQFQQRTVSSVFGSLADGRKYFGAERAYIFAADLAKGVEREELFKRVKKEVNDQGLQIGDVREIKYKIQSGLFRLLNLMSTVAFAAMAVASLGVTNTVMAGVRSRRWQFGILRSIGVTRSQLLRLVLAEAALLGLIGCALGLAAGFEMSADANALTGVLTGYRPPLMVPWRSISVGFGAVMF
ncbi:MAG: macB 7, partial [Phycisphaerales bacterium]|nr:macB 7 [Phycisphaerales bacterium]